MVETRLLVACVTGVYAILIIWAASWENQIFAYVKTKDVNEYLVIQIFAFHSNTISEIEYSCVFFVFFVFSSMVNSSSKFSNED